MFWYTGQREESSLGLYYYGARWYDPALGRFIQADSIVPDGVQGLDRYAYVNNNPLKYTDPSGYMWCNADGHCGGGAYTYSSPDKEDYVEETLQECINTDDRYALDKLFRIMRNNPVEVKTIINTIHRFTHPRNGSGIVGQRDFAIIIGVSGSPSGADIYKTGGGEIVIFPDGSMTFFAYLGEGSFVGFGAGNISVYGGVAYNVWTPQDYYGQAASIGLVASFLLDGCSIGYIWSATEEGPFSPGIPKGIIIGWSPGLNLGGWWSTTYYQPGKTIPPGFGFK